MTDLIRKPLAWLIAAVLICGALWWLVSTIAGGKSARVEAELRGNQTGAAIESGGDAVNTVGDRADADAELDRKVTDAQSNIRNASDGAAADRAARDGLCDISPDYCRSDGLQRTDP